MSKYEVFIKQVTTGKLLACVHVKNAVSRFKKDLTRKEIYFDSQAADAAIAWIETLVIGKAYKEMGNQMVEVPKTLSLTNFQAFIVANIFGWKIKKNKLRRFKYSYIEMAKGSGKTTLESAIALLFLHLVHRNGEIYTAATTRDQARQAFRYAQSLVRDTAHIAAKSLQHSIFIESTNSYFHVLSSEDSSFEGKSPDFVIVDEMHVHRDDSLYNAIKSAMVKKQGNHMSVITTAGFDKLSACYRIRQNCIEILEGKKEDDSLFSIIFTLDETDNWEDPKTWIKSNPNLGITVQLDDLVAEYRNALNNGPSQIVNFKTKNLNMWTDSSGTPLPDAVWIKNTHGISVDELINQECYAGVDLASWDDLNAIVLIFPNIREKVCILPFFYIPDTNQKGPHHDYRPWVEHGYMRTTKKNNKVSFLEVFDDLMPELRKYDVRGIAFDRKLANHGLIELLTDEGLAAFEFSQWSSQVDAPTQEFLKLVKEHDIEHFNNPVLRWMAGNVELFISRRGDMRFDKAKSRNKIDGLSATINAIAMWQAERNKEKTPEWGVTYVQL